MYTYIVIDDEELIRKGTIKKLSPMEDCICCIGEASNGKEGIDMIEKLHPDFVIMDMQMPVMDGMELLPFLNKHCPELPLIVISAYRSFDYIKQALSASAVEYLLKPFNKSMIQNCVLQVINRLDQQKQVRNIIETTEFEKEQACIEYDKQLLYNLILGYNTSESNLTSKRFSKISHNYYILITLHFRSNCSDSLLNGWLNEHDFGEPAVYIPCIETKRLGFMLLFMPAKDSLTACQLNRQIGDELLSYLAAQNIQAIAGISHTQTSLVDLNTAFLETTHALNQQPIDDYDGSAPCYFYPKDVPPLSLNWDKTDELLFRIETGTEEEIKSLAKELFLFYHSVSGCTLGDVKYHLYQIEEQCRQLLQEYLEFSKPPESSVSMHKMLNNMLSLSDTRNYYLQFFLNLNAMIQPQSIYATGDVIEHICLYMQKNLQKDLTQDFIASLFYLNRSYLSTLFRKTTGTKFIDYLNTLRIHKAAELLRTTDRKMYQIAKAVGYNNVKYFFRIFKKIMGTTPEQYRLQ